MSHSLKLIEQKQCTMPDRDEPKLFCGYPLPCPWHDRKTKGEHFKMSNETRRCITAWVGMAFVILIVWMILVLVGCKQNQPMQLIESDDDCYLEHRRIDGVWSVRTVCPDSTEDWKPAP